MIHFDRESFLNVLNGDSEFSLSARFWDADLRLGIGDHKTIFKIREGHVVEARESNSFDTTTLDLVGPESEWRRVFEPTPRPYYHHLFSAVAFHDLEWSGDIEGAFSYLTALNRLVELLRVHAQVV